MKILFDNGTPRPIERVLSGHQVLHARQIGWHQRRNGELLLRAEAEGFELFLTTDKHPVPTKPRHAPDRDPLTEHLPMAQRQAPSGEDRRRR